MAIAIKLTGVDGLLTAINKTVAQAQKETTVALNKFSDNVVKDAKAQLQHGTGKGPTSNTGKLAGSITGQVTGNTAKITVATNYAAYIEFGTRKFAAKYVATLPADWKAYAATFKGKGGGTMDEFIQDIMQWVRQRGIGAKLTKSGNVSEGKDSLDAMQQAAYAIALNILQNGIRAQPFLYPAVVKNTKPLIDDIKKIFS
jgi:phage gpG-like protein